MAEAELTAGGLSWYEVSNWAAGPDAVARHNLLYWTGGNWWGIGPGAHSHVDGRRWWNVKHPRDYAAALREGRSPEADHELLTPADRALENVMLRLRLREGLDLADLSPNGRAAAARAAADGLLDPDALTAGRAVLTLRGRLLADAVIRDLTD
jgi:oxygen-independent coproporphyrinogen-3 oxidase